VIVHIPAYSLILKRWFSDHDKTIAR